MELNDPIGILELGLYYSNGSHGLPPNQAKAFELLHRAAELGNADAYYHVGIAYYNGRGVERDEKKAIECWELAAVEGCIEARASLGISEGHAGNMDRALKHFMISIKDGDSDSLKKVKQLYQIGYATKDDYAKALRFYRAYLDEIKSEQRDEAAAADGNKYYDSAV